MANPDHLNILKQGLKAWNAWRTENPDIHPNLEYADLRGKDLQQYNLSNATLDNAQLMRCVFHGTDLSNSSLRNALGSHVNIVNANLTGADASGIILTDSQITNATIHNSVFKNANLSSSNLSQIKATGVSFNHANLQKVNFTGADLNNAIFDGSNLANANLSNAKLRNSSLVGVTANNSNFHHTDMTDAEVGNATFEGVHFGLADLRGVDFRSATINRCVFTQAIADLHNFHEDQLTTQNKEDMGYMVKKDEERKTKLNRRSTVGPIDIPVEDTKTENKSFIDGIEALITQAQNMVSNLNANERFVQKSDWMVLRSQIVELLKELRYPEDHEYVVAFRDKLTHDNNRLSAANGAIKYLKAIREEIQQNNAEENIIREYGEGKYGEGAYGGVKEKAESEGIPNEEEIKRLPRWAQVALAARCARRVQPLYTVFWPKAPQKHVDAVNLAITAAEEAYIAASTSTAISAADAAFLVASLSSGIDFASFVPSAAAHAAASVYDYPHNAFEAVADSARAAARAGFGNHINSAINRDFETLIQSAIEHDWNNETPVSPEVFGPMWPDGEPDWEQIALKKTTEGRDTKPQKYEKLYYNFIDFLINVKRWPPDYIQREKKQRLVLYQSFDICIQNPNSKYPDIVIEIKSLKSKEAIKESTLQMQVALRENESRKLKGYIVFAKELNETGGSFEIYGVPIKGEAKRSDLSEFPSYDDYRIPESYKVLRGEFRSDDELRDMFEKFLVNIKDYPAENLAAVPYLGEDEYRPNCVTEVKGNDEEILALITFRIAMDENDSAFQDMFVYEEAINMSDVPKYIVYADKSSIHTFTIHECGETGETTQVSIKDFPTFIEMLFLSPLSGAGRRLYSSVIELAKNKCNLKLDAVCKDYINLKKNNRVAAQIHRLNDSEKNIALVLAGYQSVFPEPMNEPYVFKGELSQLSGNTKEHPKEIAWLNGNVNHQRLRFRAGVYVLLPGSLVFPEVEEEVGGLIDLAAKNTGDNDKNDRGAKKGSGTIPTMASDKADVKDLLGRKLLAQSLAKMFMHTKEIEGLTVALLGDWGEGKSTVMNLVEKELKKEPFEFAKFNAWEYEHTDNITAGLAQEVVRGLSSGICFSEKLGLRCRFSWKEHQPKLIKLGAQLLLFLCLLSISTTLFIIASILGNVWTTIAGFIVGGGAASIPFFSFGDVKKLFEHPLSTELQTYLKLPNYGEHLGLVPVLKRHLKTLCELRLGKDRKLLVFVDDLDRCQPECISKTLDAIRLVMSISNVIVMIGIDHRIAFKAVEKTYEELGDDDGRNQADIARDYLGKIILLPVRLMATGPEELKEYVDKKLCPDAIESLPEPKASSGESIAPEPATDSRSRDERFDVLPEVAETEDLSSVKAPPSSQPTKEELQEQEIEEAMRETTEERDRFYDLAVKFKFSNPRQLLRLRNCYRLLKALNSQKEHQIEDLLPMIFWQEFLHAQRREMRNWCMAVLKDKTHVKMIEDRDVRQIVNDICDEIATLFQPDGEYKELAEFVRCVVLPHSEEGVFDTSEEVEEWIERQDSNMRISEKKHACPLGLKRV